MNVTIRRTREQMQETIDAYRERERVSAAALATSRSTEEWLRAQLREREREVVALRGVVAACEACEGRLTLSHLESVAHEVAGSLECLELAIKGASEEGTHSAVFEVRQRLRGMQQMLARLIKSKVPATVTEQREEWTAEDILRREG